MMKKFLLTAILAVLIPAGLSAQIFDLALYLSVDSSGSIDTTEYGLQKTGYAAAFQTGGIVDQLFSNPNSNLPTGFKMIVAYGEWSGSGSQLTRVDWTPITSAAEADAFGDAIAALSRAMGGSTYIGQALTFAGNEFVSDTRASGATRRVIDISGDGINSGGITADQGRTNALNAGVQTINGLVIQPTTGLLNEYNTNVKYNGFVVSADDFDDFSNALEIKLEAEILDIDPVIPEPATVGFLSLAGLAGFLWIRRRRAVTTVSVLA